MREGLFPVRAKKRQHKCSQHDAPSFRTRVFPREQGGSCAATFAFARWFDLAARCTIFRLPFSQYAHCIFCPGPRERLRPLVDVLQLHTDTESTKAGIEQNKKLERTEIKIPQHTLTQRDWVKMNGKICGRNIRA